MSWWYVYVARCADGSLYCGITRDVMARLAQHSAGKGAKYTRGRGPLVLVAARRCRTKNTALRLELAVKRLARPEKERLVDAKRFQALARKITSSARTTCSTRAGAPTPS